VTRRVRHLVKGLGPGGAERLIVTQATTDTTGWRHDVVYLLAHKDHLVAELESAGIAVARLGGSRGRSLGWMWQFRQNLLRDPVDVVHVHSPVLAVACRLLARTIRRRPAVVTTEHNRWPRHHRLTRLANRLTIRLNDATIAVSDDVRSTIQGIDTAKVTTIVHGVDLAAVRASVDRTAVRAELGAAADDIVVATVANFRREKALEILIAAAAEAMAEAPTLRYVLIGQGPLADELAAAVAGAGIGERFQILGYRSDATRVLSGADVFTLSSRHEGLPVAMMEALALGIPVAATAAGGIPAGLGEAGLLCPVDRPSDLAALHVRLATNAACRSDLALAARMHGELFSAARATDEIVAVYAKALACAGIE
jgi:glycosyltransferase involved in cell wall biosynthesis